jgi:anti-sigma regulatory factor (Ser/Thr protein kinase)
MTERTTLNIPASIENLDSVLEFVDARLEEENCSLKELMTINVAGEEIFVNIASYAYKSLEEGDAHISVWFEEDPKTVSIEFRDSGVYFDPLAKDDPDVTLSAAERQIGGLGIFMVKKSMDAVQYKRENDQNILTIRKKL